MAEQHEDETRPQAGEPPAAQPYPTGDPGVPRPPRDGRFRRWSRSAPAQFAAVGLVAGLVGGLVGGGIVAAVDGGHHDQPQFMRVGPGMPPGFGLRRFGGPPRGRFFPMRPGGPMQQRPNPNPTPTPTPTTTS